ncbi:hypothetical protein ABTL47_19460, partial [Acinetobacter baumannii]
KVLNGKSERAGAGISPIRISSLRDGLSGARIRSDSGGGLAAIWLALPNRPLLEQPVVFLGSEGQRGVVACNFDEYLWLLAGGMEPVRR